VSASPKKKHLLFRVRHGKIPDAKRLLLDAWLAANDGKLVELTVQRFANRHSDVQRAYWFAVVVPADRVGRPVPNGDLPIGGNT